LTNAGLTGNGHHRTRSISDFWRDRGLGHSKADRKRVWEPASGRRLGQGGRSPLGDRLPHSILRSTEGLDSTPRWMVTPRSKLNFVL
jgi:hypothetical protein